MSMFNSDGQIVAGVLQTREAGEVFRDILGSRSAIKAEEMKQQQFFALQQSFTELVSRYNSLADRYNGVLAENKRVDAAHTSTVGEKDILIAQLIAEKQQLADEREESRSSAYEGWTKLTRALEEIERLKIKSGELPPNKRDPNLDL